MAAPGNCSGRREFSPGAGLLLGSLHGIWQVVRLLLLALLQLIGPLIRLILSVLGVLSLLTAFFYRFVSNLPPRSFWILVGFGLACGAAVQLQARLLRLLTR